MKEVLIVEDSMFIANAIKIILQSAEISAEISNDGQKAIDLARQKTFDLIMLDLMMPNMSGDEVFRILRSDNQTRSIPVMILTAKTDALKWNKDLESCDKFMTKPFDKSDLLVQVKELLNSKDFQKRIS